MASSQDYLFYVLELLQKVEGVTYRKMMGEYLLYKDGVLFGGIYDNRFLLKKGKALEGKGFKEHIPYPGAKPMFLLDQEDPFEVEETVMALYNDLKG